MSSVLSSPLSLLQAQLGHSPDPTSLIALFVAWAIRNLHPSFSLKIRSCSTAQWRIRASKQSERGQQDHQPAPLAPSRPMTSTGPSNSQRLPEEQAEPVKTLGSATHDFSAYKMFLFFLLRFPTSTFSHPSSRPSSRPSSPLTALLSRYQGKSQRLPHLLCTWPTRVHSRLLYSLHQVNTRSLLLLLLFSSTASSTLSSLSLFSLPVHVHSCIHLRPRSPFALQYTTCLPSLLFVSLPVHYL